MPYVRINQFDGGMSSDPRDPRENVSRICEHFDIYSNKYKLSPQLSFESGDAAADTNRIKNFAFDGTILYGFGIDGTAPALFKKTNFTDSTWTNKVDITSGSGSVGFIADNPFFVYYKTTNKLYGALTDGSSTNRYIFAVAPQAGSPFFTGDGRSADLTSFTNMSNGIVHSKDDILYVGYDNKIAANNNDSWTIPALTLPARYVITQLAEYGNYLAIGCRSIYAGESVVFLWDRNSSVTTLSESLSWGAGNLMILESLEGYLIGVSYDSDTATGANFKNTRVSFRYYAGSGQPIEFNKLVGLSSSPAISSSLYRYKYRNRILFGATIPVDTTGYAGVWSISRSSTGVPFAVTLEYLNKSAGANSGTPSSHFGLFQIGDCLFSSYFNRESSTDVMYMDKVNDAVTYTTTSVYQTTVNPQMTDGDRPLIKHVMAVGLTYEPLPSGASVTLKYRKNGGSWITVFTETTLNKVSTLVERGSDGVSFGTAEEWEFRVESTGNAEITSLNYRYDTVANALNK